MSILTELEPRYALLHIKSAAEYNVIKVGPNSDP